MIKELIFELPINKVSEIKEFLNTYRNEFLETYGQQRLIFHELKKAVFIRETIDRHDKLQKKLADKSVIVKQPKI